MFGTMTRFRPKAGCEDAFRDYLTGEGAERSREIEGFLSEYLLEPVNPGEDWVAFIVFDSEANYRKNAVDPAQDEEYRKLLEHVTAPPTWLDGIIRPVEASSVAI
jgi:heme-degrading monooxygenase HmoA